MVGGKYVIVPSFRLPIYRFSGLSGIPEKTAQFNSKYLQDVDVFVFNCKHNNQYFSLC